jgi:hypothetical protein
MDEPWWRVPDRLPVIREDGGPAPLDSDTLLPLTGFRRVAGIPYPAPFLGSSSQVVTHDEP